MLRITDGYQNEPINLYIGYILKISWGSKMVVQIQVQRDKKEGMFLERILHIHLLGEEDMEAHKEMSLLKRKIGKTISIMTASRDSLIMKVLVSKEEEKEILRLAKRFKRILVWVEWW